MTTPEELSVAVEFMKEKINAVDERAQRIENKVDELGRRVLSREGMELICAAKHGPLVQRVEQVETDVSILRNDVEPLKRFRWTATGIAIGASAFISALGVLLQHFLGGWS